MNRLYLALVLLVCLQAQPTLPSIEVEAMGVAPLGANRAAAIQEATRDAQSRAIEQVAGIQVAALDVGRDQQIQISARLAVLQGLVLSSELIGDPIEDRENRLIKVRIRARVLSVRDLQSHNDWRTLWKTFGHPPLQLLLDYSGDPKYKAIALQQSKTSLLKALQEIGVQPVEDKGQRATNEKQGTDGWLLRVHIRVEPVSAKGNPDAPYGIGDRVASWQVKLTLAFEGAKGQGPRDKRQVAKRTGEQEEKTPNSELRTANPKSEIIGEWQAIGGSLISDAEAVQKAARTVIERSLQDHWREQLSQTWMTSILAGR